MATTFKKGDIVERIHEGNLSKITIGRLDVITSIDDLYIYIERNDSHYTHDYFHKCYKHYKPKDIIPQFLN